MKNKPKVIGALALFVVFAVLLAIDGLATLSIIGVTQLDENGDNLTIMSSTLANTTECNVTIGVLSYTAGNTSISFMMPTYDNVPWINATAMNISDEEVEFEWDTLGDGIYQISSAVCINLTGGDTDNASTGIATDIVVDFTSPSMIKPTTKDDVEFDKKADVAVIVDTGNWINTSQCMVVFDGGKFPNNDPGPYIVNATSGNNSCVFTWDSNTLVDGVYRYAVAGFDSINTSLNYSESSGIPKFYEFHLKEATSAYTKMAALKQAGYTSIDTAQGTIDLQSMSLFGEGITSTSNVVVLIIIGVLIYLLFFRKKK